MMRIKPVTRISISLVLLTVGVLLLADMFGFVPDSRQATISTRQLLCESIAVQVSHGLQEDAQPAITALVQALTERNPDIISSGLRRIDGGYFVQSADHALHWTPVPDDTSTPSQVQVPIYQGTQRWGTLEILFTPLQADGVLGYLQQPLVRMMLFTAILGFFLYVLLLKRSLKYLDPSSVIPGRVKATLDILAEGVALVDDEGNLVLANRSLAQKTGSDPERLLGKALADLGWRDPASGRPVRHFPWLNAMQEGKSCIGVPMQIRDPGGLMRTLMVNSSPITDGNGQCRGALATFDDVTQLEMKNAQLEEMLHMLKDSQDKVHEQNDQLRVLASEDALTKCLNRRALFERIETEFELAQARENTLSCIMCDIDHFKSINDRFGHGTGDRVIEEVARTLRTIIREGDAVGRYGGEEFCILLPRLTLNQAIETAERLRARIEKLEIGDLRVTASFGLTSSEFGARDIRELLHQADTALYTAKNNGRNAVAVWGRTPPGDKQPLLSVAGNPNQQR